MLNCKKFAILTANRVKMINVHNRAKFRGNWSNRYRESATLAFTKFEISAAITMKRLNLHHRTGTKFYVNRSDKKLPRIANLTFQHGGRPSCFF